MDIIARGMNKREVRMLLTILIIAFVVVMFFMFCIMKSSAQGDRAAEQVFKEGENAEI